MEDREAEPGKSEIIRESDRSATPQSAPSAKDFQAGGFLDRARQFVPVAVIGIFFLAVPAFLYFAKPFVMPIVLAVLLSFLLKPMVRSLARVRIPAPLAAVLVMAAFFTVVFFAATRLVQPAGQWVAKAPETVGRVQARFEQWFRQAERSAHPGSARRGVEQSRSSETPPPHVDVQPPALIGTVFTFTKSFVTELIETMVLLFFMLSAGDRFMHTLVKVLPTLHDKQTAVDIANEVEKSLSTFLFTITAINAVLGLFVCLAAFLVGLPNPVLWGVLAGVLNFIPYLGPITGVIILLLAGCFTFDSPLEAVLPSVIYLSLHALESNWITPIILGRRLTLNPLVIFISLIFWTWLWGVPGALLSIPMLMMLRTLCDHFPSLAPIGEFLNG